MKASVESDAFAGAVRVVVEEFALWWSTRGQVDAVCSTRVWPGMGEAASGKRILLHRAALCGLVRMDRDEHGRTVYAPIGEVQGEVQGND
jgi:hypothetical protein